jgi:hypothetical protein
MSQTLRDGRIGAITMICDAADLRAVERRALQIIGGGRSDSC